VQLKIQIAIRQPLLGNVGARRRQEAFVAIDPDDLPAGPDAPAKRLKNADRATAQVEAAPTWLHSNLIGQQLYIRLPDARLHAQPLGLGRV
jgi:hypothetical protein